jgi:hypothetical protein
MAVLGRICARLLHYLGRFRDRLIGRTSAFGAEYRGSSPRPGTKIRLDANSVLRDPLDKSHFAIVQQDNTDQRDT